MFTYDFIRQKAPWATVYIWGHSLGTGQVAKIFLILISGPIEMQTRISLKQVWCPILLCDCASFLMFPISSKS